MYGTRQFNLWATCFFLFVDSVIAQELVLHKPPVAQIEPTELTTHGHTRIDEYYWMNDRDNPNVIAYLQEENAYLESTMAQTRDLQEILFNEIKGRIKQDDATVPYRLDDYYYYSRYEDGKQYPIYCRKKESLEAPEEVILDVNKLARGHDFFHASGHQVSPNQDLYAFAADTVGRRFYTIRIKNLKTGEMLPDEIPQVTNMMTWANDNRTLFYVKQDPVTLRWSQIFRHTLGTNPSEDVLVYEEPDETFSTYIFKTKSKKFLMISSSQTLSTEYRYLDASDPNGEFQVIQPRERNHEYRVDHFGGHFFIATNLGGAKNFQLMKTPVTKTTKENWEVVVPHRDDVFIDDFQIFSDHLVLSERRDGLLHIRIMPWEGKEDYYLDFGEPAYAAYLDRNPDINSKLVRYVYSSLTTPWSTYDYDTRTRKKNLLKRDEVLGGFDQANYVTERLHAVARDGAEVPVSVVYRKGAALDGTAPLLLYGYGSYGASEDAMFDPLVLSLLDRGFVYAIAHIRGGQELGREWYENGKLLKKKNTFTDFIDAAEYLVKAEYADRDRLFALGGSAGGLLMGAVVNMRPDLWKGVVAEVPFVDVVTTMLDDSIPLTTSEYDEWGNPNDKTYYDYMLTYSPYDNVEAKDYPNMLVTTGLHDSQVQYWEPAKWVARLRTIKTDNNLLLLKTNMEAGHGGASGRYDRYREWALIYAFLLDLAGIK